MIEVAGHTGAKCWQCRRRCRWAVGPHRDGPLPRGLAIVVHTCGLHVARALAKVQKAIDDWDKKPKREKFPDTTYTGE